MTLIWQGVIAYVNYNIVRGHEKHRKESNRDLLLTFPNNIYHDDQKRFVGRVASCQDDGKILDESFRIKEIDIRIVKL